MKKLSIMIFMAASMLAACDNSNKSENAAQPGDPDYVSTNGVGIDKDPLEMEQTSNSEIAAEGDEMPSEGASDAEMRARKAMASEEERVAYWTVDEASIEATEESVRGNLDQMDKNFDKMETDIAHIKTGTYNPEGRLSRAALNKLNQAQARIDEAKQQTQQARQRYQAGKHEAAAEKIKSANKKLAEAREKYMSAIETETGVEMEENQQQ